MATDSYVPRMKEQYENEIRPALKDELGLSSIMQVPRIQKITLNMGVGEAKTNSKLLDEAVEHMTLISGQKPVVTQAKRSISAGRISSEYLSFSRAMSSPVRSLSAW